MSTPREINVTTPMREGMRIEYEYGPHYVRKKKNGQLYISPRARTVHINVVQEDPTHFIFAYIYRKQLRYKFVSNYEKTGFDVEPGKHSGIICNSRWKLDLINEFGHSSHGTLLFEQDELEKEAIKAQKTIRRLQQKERRKQLKEHKKDVSDDQTEDKINESIEHNDI